MPPISGNPNESSNNASTKGEGEKRFKQVEWFKPQGTQQLQTGGGGGGIIQLESPVLAKQRQQQDSRKQSVGFIIDTQHIHQQQIITQLEQHGIKKNDDIRKRCTKIVCTIGKKTKTIEAVEKMLNKGMNVARINMNYFDVTEQEEIVSNIKTASEQSGKPCGIMVDLKGPLIRTLGFKDHLYSIKVVAGQEVRISSNQNLQGDEGMFVIDYPDIHEKLKLGDKIVIDYGGLLLTVVGFEHEENYRLKQKKKQKAQNKQDQLQKEKQEELMKMNESQEIDTKIVFSEKHEEEKKHLEEKLSQSPPLMGALQYSDYESLSPQAYKIRNLSDDENAYKNEDIIERSDEEGEEEEGGGGEKQQEEKIQFFSNFPTLDRVETHTHQINKAQQTKVIAEEYEFQEAKFNEVIKKRHQGQNAENMCLKAQKALRDHAKTLKEKQKKIDLENQQDDFNEGGEGDSSLLALVEESNKRKTSNGSQKASLFQQYRINRYSSGLDSTPLNEQLVGYEKSNGNTFGNINNKLNIPPKEYLMKKRLSKVEQMRDKNRLFAFKRGSGSKGNRNNQRNSVSPSSRNSDRQYLHQNQHHSTVADNHSSISNSDCDFQLNKFPITREYNSPEGGGHRKDTQSNQQQQQQIGVLEEVKLQYQQQQLQQQQQQQQQEDKEQELVFSKDKVLVVCRADIDGEIKVNKPVCFLGLDQLKDLKLSVLGPNDVKVLHNSFQFGVNMIAVSCAQSKEDIIYVKKVLGVKGQHIKILAKLQSKKALDNIDSLIEVSDGIIIARGYLGLSIDLEDVVYVQKYIIKKCNLLGKPVIISTQILESMVSKNAPTRSEIVDIQNAIYDGIDAFILSPETSIGDYYEQAIETMSHICYEAESYINYQKRYQEQEKLLKMRMHRTLQLNPSLSNADVWTTEDTIASCAVKASFNVKASLIIVFTNSGLTATKVAKHKPKCPIIAVFSNEWASKSVLLHRGVESMVVGSLIGSDLLIQKIINEAMQQRGLLKKGDFIIVTSGLSGSLGSTNLLQILRV